MSLSIGIVGLPNVGKSTLFNALLKRQVALAASYPFATIEPNVGVVEVPDERLKRLADLVAREEGDTSGRCPEKITPATIRFIDIAGLVAGAHRGEGLGNKFLSHIREVDAILHVLRGFEDVNVDRAGSVSPQKDIELINTELLLADLQTVERRLEAKNTPQERSFLYLLKENLEKGIRTSALNLNEDQRMVVRELSLLTQKPILYVINISEGSLFAQVDPAYIPICAKLESELSSFSEEERLEMMTDLGLRETGLDMVIRRSYEILGLQSFLTGGPKEVRAWTIKKGTKAPQAAGVIHTDFERGFISCEVISLDRLEEAGGWKTAKEGGLVRLEGRDYIMKEGDVVLFRFNV